MCIQLLIELEETTGRGLGGVSELCSPIRISLNQTVYKKANISIDLVYVDTCGQHRKSVCRVATSDPQLRILRSLPQPTFPAVGGESRVLFDQWKQIPMTATHGFRR